MKSYLALALALTTTQAHAIGNLNLDLRVDSNSQTFNDAAKTAALGQNNQRYIVQTGRLDYRANINDMTSMRFRYRFNRVPVGAPRFADNLNNEVDFAFVSHKVSEAVRLTVGKFATDVGGIEASTPGADLYHTSEAYTGTTWAGGTVAGNSGYLYATGVKLGYTMGAHTVNVLGTNLDSEPTGTTATNFGQTRQMVGLSYLGSYMEKAVSVIASYHMQEATEGNKRNFLAAGAGYTLGAFVVQADYAMNTFEVGSNKNTLSSIGLRGIYNIDPMMSVQAKVTTSEEKIGSTNAKNTYQGVSAAFEWKPKAEDVFRYHVAVADRTMKPGAVGAAAALESRKLTEVIVGVRVLADFLK